MNTLRVTLDTNVMDGPTYARLRQAAKGLLIEFMHTTVSARELEGSSILPIGGTIYEVGVWGESRWGKAVWGSSGTGPTDDEQLFEDLLRLVSHGAFPPRSMREALTNGQRHQMRDVMILAAHIRERRDIFITNERKAFVGKDGTLRQELETRYSVRIMDVEEFSAHCDRLRHALPSDSSANGQSA